MAVDAETPWRKKFIVIFAGVLCLLTAGLDIYWIVRAGNANYWESDSDKWQDKSGFERHTHVFDMCKGFDGVEEQDVRDICEPDHSECFEKINTNWSVVFEFNAVTMTMLAFSLVLISVGAC